MNPDLITTGTQIADQGVPRIIVIKGDFEGLEPLKGLGNLNAQAVAFLTYKHPTFHALLSIVGFSNIVSTFFNWLQGFFSSDQSNRLRIGQPKEEK